MALVDRIAARHRGDEIVRADAVSLEEFGYLLGQRGGIAKSRSGVTVTPDRAMGISAWYRGVRYLSETVASLPAHHYERVPVGDARNRVPASRWMREPHPEIPWFGLVEFWMMSVLHRGNAWAWKVRDAAGVVVGLDPIHPKSVRFGVTSGGLKQFAVKLADGSERPATPFEMLHIPGLSSDGYYGLDPIRYHAATLGRVAAADEYADKFFGQGTQLRAYLSMPGAIDDTEADRLRRQWERLHSGLNGSEFGVIGDGTTYNTIELDPEQVQLLESRKFGVTEIARILGVVPHKLYDLERATFSNIEHQAIESVTDSIRPWAVRFEAHINRDRTLVRPLHFVEFELEGMLRGDTKSRYEAYSAATGGPWMSRNEARRLENLRAVDGLDAVLTPLNMDPAGDEALDVAGLTLALQKIYLAVQGGVITAREARQILNREGAGLPEEVPDE